jgi:hypothetical protein
MKLRPSSAHRWLSCTASHELESLYPDEQSAFAEEGTLAHETAAAILSGQLAGCEDPYIMKYVRFVQRIATNRTLLIETRVAPTAAVSGTADAIVIGKRKVFVIDLKFGKGVAVSAPRNEQLMLYALGAVQPGIKQYELIIHQPRMNSVSRWNVSLGELLEFKERVEGASAAIATGKTRYVPSEKACRFCKARKDCISKAETPNMAVGDFAIL